MKILIKEHKNSFDSSAFLNFCVEGAENYRNAEPFPNICIENVFSLEYLRSVISEFPSLSEMNVESGGKSVHIKGHISDVDRMGENTRALIQYMNSPKFLGALETLTGIRGLIPDPYMIGGGLHCTANGGYLKVHADFDCHPRFKLSRRLNVLLYLNENWESEWGGQIELWSRDMTRKVCGFDPIFSRMVIFSTGSDTFHGHPDPMTLPDDTVTRKSIALYYYTNEPREMQAAEEHTTVYKARPGELFKRAVLKADAKVKKAKPLKPVKSESKSWITRFIKWK